MSEHDNYTELGGGAIYQFDDEETRDRAAEIAADKNGGLSIWKYSIDVPVDSEYRGGFVRDLIPDFLAASREKDTKYRLEIHPGKDSTINAQKTLREAAEEALTE